jgi:hypothetical protein
LTLIIDQMNPALRRIRAMPPLGNGGGPGAFVSAGSSGRTSRFYQRTGAISSVVVSADTSTDPAAPPPWVPGGRPGPWRRSKARKVVFAVLLVGFVAFWVWALFFASKEAVNKVEDRAWAERAEAICAVYDAQIRALEGEASEDIQVRAALVVESTDLLAAMLDEITDPLPSDEKGRAIVPDWEADYRTLLQNRYDYAERLRSGENVPFTETAVNGVPITERIETFAGDNEMDSCAPPRGSIV